MIDAARSFRKILRDWGHDIHLQRMLPNGNHNNEFEKVTTRQVGQSGSMNAKASDQYDEGISTNFEFVYYFEGNVNPKEGDRIYEDMTMKNSRSYSIFTIQAVTPVRGKFGKIVYWIAGASREK